MSEQTTGSPDTSASPGATPPPRRRGGLLGVGIACIVAGILLVVLLLPHVLLYPEEPPAPEVPDWDRQVGLLKENNGALEEEIARLEGLLGAGICRLEDGTLKLPDAPGTPPASPGGGTEGGTGGGRSEAPMLPTPQPASLAAPVTPGTAPEAASRSLLQLLDDATVLVVSVYPDGVGFGSGFSVAPGRILTNRHVVEDAEHVLIVNTQLGAPREVKVLTVTTDAGFNERDYALLEVSGATDLPILGFAAIGNDDRLAPVIAAGFPGLVLSTDAKFEALMTGDMGAMPGMAVTQGIITVVQNSEAVPLVVHTAQVSPGNSGGPLVDLCGRAVGINTFVSTDETSAHVNYALGSNDIAAFLNEAGIATPASTETCQPVALSAASETPPAGGEAK